jgi:hypothetical protein
MTLKYIVCDGNITPLFERKFRFTRAWRRGARPFLALVKRNVCAKKLYIVCLTTFRDKTSRSG